MAQHADATYGDLNTPQIHMLAGLIDVQHAGLARATVFQNLHAANNAVEEDATIRLLPVVTVREWCHAQGLDPNGTRPQLVTLLYLQANPLPAPVPPVVPAGNVSLPEMKNRISVTSFSDRDLRQAAVICFEDTARALGIWQQVEPGWLNAPPPHPDIADPVVAQRVERLKLEVHGMLGKGIQTQLNKDLAAQQVGNDAWSIMRWINDKFVDLGEAQQCLDETKLAQYTWKKSKKSFKDWSDRLQELMGEVRQRHYPTPLSFATALRQKIFENVERNVPEIRAFLSEAENRGPQENGGRPEDIISGLIQRMTRHMSGLNKNEEKAFEVFATELVTKADVETFHADQVSKLQKENEKEKKQLQTYSSFSNPQPSTSFTNSIGTTANANCI